MMVLLGAARFGPRRNASHPPSASTFSARGSCDSRNAWCCYIIQPPSDVREPSPSKGVERRGVDSLCGVGSCWQVVVW